MGRPRRRRRNRGNSRWSSVRVTTTRGSGASKTTSYRTGGLYITSVGPTGRIANTRPTIWATIVDEGNSLAKSDIRLYVDGSQKTRFHYDRASGRLSYYGGNALAPGNHRVEIEAGAQSGDSQGRFDGSARKRWTFYVVKR